MLRVIAAFQFMQAYFEFGTIYRPLTINVTIFLLVKHWRNWMLNFLTNCSRLSLHSLKFVHFHPSLPDVSMRLWVPMSPQALGRVLSPSDFDLLSLRFKIWPTFHPSFSYTGSAWLDSRSLLKKSTPPPTIAWCSHHHASLQTCQCWKLLNVHNML